MKLKCSDERRRVKRFSHAAPVFSYVRGIILRSLTGVEARVESLRYPTFAGEEGMVDVGQRGKRGRADNH
jgi:hypothetical protein